MSRLCLMVLSSLIRLSMVLSISLLGTRSMGAEIGVTDKEILIGQSTGLTGPAAVQVKHHRQGEQLYFDKINAAGGINGRKIKVISLDDGYDPHKTVANTERLIQTEKVFALFKYFGTPGVKAAMPQIEKSGVPLIGPTSGAEFLYVRVQPNLFLVRPSYFIETEQLVDYLVSKRKAQKIAILRPDDGYGTEGRNGIQKALQKHNLRVVGEAIYNEKTDYHEAYRTLAATQPDAIILWSLLKPATEFMKVAKDAGYPGLIAGCTTISSPEFAKSAEGAIMPFAAPLASPGSHYAVVQQYLKDAKAAQQEPDSLSFRGYLDALILTEAIKFAGKELTRAALKTAFETKLHGFDLGGISLNYGPENHAGLSSIFLGHVKGGKYELFEQ